MSFSSFGVFSVRAMRYFLYFPVVGFRAFSLLSPPVSPMLPLPAVRVLGRDTNVAGGLGFGGMQWVGFVRVSGIFVSRLPPNRCYRWGRFD